MDLKNLSQRYILGRSWKDNLPKLMFSKLFHKKPATPSTDFSKFFVLSKASEKKKVMKEIVKKANADQKLLYHSV